jgi:hypothetical protein
MIKKKKPAAPAKPPKRWNATQQAMLLRKLAKWMSHDPEAQAQLEFMATDIERGLAAWMHEWREANPIVLDDHRDD